MTISSRPYGREGIAHADYADKKERRSAAPAGIPEGRQARKRSESVSPICEREPGDTGEDPSGFAGGGRLRSEHDGRGPGGGPPK